MHYKIRVDNGRVVSYKYHNSWLKAQTDLKEAKLKFTAWDERRNF